MPGPHQQDNAMIIAQVSDIHAAPDNDNLQRLDRVLRWLDHLQPDLVVLSGDLAEDKWRNGYQQIADRLSKSGCPSFVLPGNSDDRHLMRSVWNKPCRAKKATNDALHFVYHSPELNIIGLDTTVDAHVHGSVTEHLDWLETELNEAGDTPILLFLHHHLFASGIPTLDESMCQGAQALEALFQRTPARLLALSSGHVHRAVAASFAGIPAYICGSVCPANPLWFGTVNVPPVSDPPALMIHRYANHALTSHHVTV